MPVVADKDLVLSGGFGTPHCSARSGFLPIPLRSVPVGALRDLDVFLRHRPAGAPGPEYESFLLRWSADTPLTTEDHAQLVRNGVQFVYIRIADHARFRREVEDSLVQTVADPTKKVSEKSAIVYETAIELVNELLSEPDLYSCSTRLKNVTRAVATLVLNDSRAFSQLFAASHHDFYTATHMVNVATWMVPLACSLGYHNQDDLTDICQAGLLHDVGKIFVPEKILDKRGPLTPEDWEVVKQHPRLGWKHLESCEQIQPVVLEVGLQHHERLDGSGYPDGLKGEQIHPVSRICAVIDSFDAMTALRPFKKKALSVSDAILALKAGAPTKYDARIVDAWVALLAAVDDRDMLPQGLPRQQSEAGEGEDLRRNKRYGCECAARVHVLKSGPDGRLREERGMMVNMHSVSRSGLGFLSSSDIALGQRVRVYMLTPSCTGKFVTGLTVRCRGYRDGWYEVGVELAQSQAYALETRELIHDASSPLEEETEEERTPSGPVLPSSPR